MTARTLGPLFSLALLVALPAAAQADGRVASAAGAKQVNGQTVYVDVVVAVPRSQTARQATDQALAQQGAIRQKPPWAGGPGGGGGGGGGGDQYFYTGLKWNSPVTQNYNSAGQRVSAKSALTNTYSDWSTITGSTYSIGYGADTSRCPSLVQQCTGPQVTDGFNDVGWASLSGSTLGVTWFVTGGDPEADMALSTRFTWKTTCGSGSGYDVETVFLHENGHVAGLDHTNRTDSVMYPSYQAPRCTLYQYDKDAMANLY